MLTLFTMCLFEGLSHSPEKPTKVSFVLLTCVIERESKGWWNLSEPWPDFQINMSSTKLHPLAGEDLSLKNDEHDQTIWNCLLEL